MKDGWEVGWDGSGRITWQRAARDLVRGQGWIRQWWEGGELVLGGRGGGGEVVGFKVSDEPKSFVCYCICRNPALPVRNNLRWLLLC